MNIPRLPEPFQRARDEFTQAEIELRGDGMVGHANTYEHCKTVMLDAWNEYAQSLAPATDRFKYDPPPKPRKKEPPASNTKIANEVMKALFPDLYGKSLAVFAGREMVREILNKYLREPGECVRCDFGDADQLQICRVCGAHIGEG